MLQPTLFRVICKMLPGQALCFVKHKAIWGVIHQTAPFSPHDQPRESFQRCYLRYLFPLPCKAGYKQLQEAPYHSRQRCKMATRLGTAGFLCSPKPTRSASRRRRLRQVCWKRWKSELSRSRSAKPRSLILPCPRGEPEVLNFQVRCNY